MHVVASEVYCSYAVASDSSRLLMKRSRMRSLLVLAVMMLRADEWSQTCCALKSAVCCPVISIGLA